MLLGIYLSVGTICVSVYVDLFVHEYGVKSLWGETSVICLGQVGVVFFTLCSSLCGHLWEQPLSTGPEIDNTGY